MAEPPKQKIELPTEEELGKLSRSAILTISIRCALRVLPFLRESIETTLLFQDALQFCTLYSTGSFTQNGSDTKKHFKRIKSVINRSTDYNQKFAIHTSQAIRATFFLASDLQITEIDASAKQARLVSVAMLESISNKESNLTDDAILEIRSDFEDLIKRYKGTDRPIDKDFYSKPLWTHLDESNLSKIDQTVGEWIERIQTESEETFPIYYWHFFDARRHGEIPWHEIETEVREWLAHLEADDAGESSDEESAMPEMPSLNTDGAPSSLGSGMSDTDLLGRENLVNSLAAMIASPGQDTPFTIGLLGDWGSGKSNVMHLLRIALSERADKERFYFADFNAWEYEHTDNMAAGVAQEVLKGFLERKSSWQKFVIKWKFGKQENGVLLPFILIAVFVVAILSLVMIFLGDSQGWIAAFGVSSVLIAGFIKHIFTILEHPLTAKVNNYLKLPSYAVHLGTIPMLKKHLKILSDIIITPDEGNPNRLIVFVDDLDRCEPQAISKTLDAIRLVMDIENVVVIIGIDHRIAFRAVEKQYVDLADDERTSADIARDYLGKIIQLPVMLNQPGENELQNFISNSLFKGVEDPPVKEDQKTENVTGQIPASGTDPKKDGKSGESEKTTPKKSLGTEDGDDPEDQNPVKEQQETISDESTAVKPMAANPAAEMDEMGETGEEKLFFSKMCKLFGLHNPRQLIRLRNCYRLLKRIYRLTEEDWKRQMAMLFWLEFLYAQQQEIRAKIELCIDNQNAGSLAACLPNESVTSEKNTINLKELFGLENGDFASYTEIESKVKRLVLPHSESAKRAKEEAETPALEIPKDQKKEDTNSNPEE
ncbi:MAG: hypothetical protein EA359_11025 [Balneolaceae bacterium]|nr:MAG: hypothetical protein EA359_11025 [Balneolaceae bacterium]